jgi:hypothetical protein
MTLGVATFTSLFAALSKVGVATARVTFISVLCSLHTQISFDQYARSFLQGVQDGTATCNEQFNPLKKDVDAFVAKRAAERRALSERLLLADVHVAIVNGDPDTVARLLGDNDPRNAVDVNKQIDVLVCHRGGGETAEAAHANEGAVTAMCVAVLNDKSALVKLLGAKGGDPNLRCGNGDSYVQTALKRRLFDTVQGLFTAGADVNRVETESSGETLLHLYARDSNDTTILRLLVAAERVDLNARAKDGKTALHTACLASGNLAEPVAKMLLEAGALPNCSDNVGEVALHHTTPGTLQTLIVSKGARLKIANHAQRKCVDDAQAAAMKATAKAYDKAPAVPSDKSSIDEKNGAWMPDGASDRCYACPAAWGTFTRRHHCRRCGILCCSDCSRKKAHEIGRAAATFRVCDGCFNRCRARLRR